VLEFIFHCPDSSMMPPSHSSLLYTDIKMIVLTMVCRFNTARTDCKEETIKLVCTTVMSNHTGSQTSLVKFIIKNLQANQQNSLLAAKQRV
jgi:hypothetical protein